jgi:hypothetical protein
VSTANLPAALPRSAALSLGFPDDEPNPNDHS